MEMSENLLQKKVDINIGWKETSAVITFLCMGFIALLSLIWAQIIQLSMASNLSQISMWKRHRFQYHPEKSGQDGIRRLSEVLK